MLNITPARIFNKTLPLLATKALPLLVAPALVFGALLAATMAPSMAKAEAIQSEFSPREPTQVKSMVTGTPDVIVVPRAGLKRNAVGGNSESTAPMQELVILNTDKGFIPSTVRMRKGTKYIVHVVNVNEKEKNVSFVLDGFAQHQSTYYGKVTEFSVEPKTEGVYSFQCPETALEGRMVVFSPPDFKSAPMMGPAIGPVKPEPVSIRVPTSVVPGGGGDTDLFGSGK